MELESLPEHILLKICRYTDRKSKLNLCQLVNLVPNIEILELSETKLKKPIENWPEISHKFQKLKTLNIPTGFSVVRGL
jgi:hypothetical protein